MSNTKKKGIIFGATDEVGAHIAYEISKKGGDIILQGNTKSDLELLRKKLENIKNNQTFLYCDHSKIENFNNIDKVIANKFDKLDFVISCLGQINSLKPLADPQLKEWNTIISQNLTINWYILKKTEVLLGKSQKPNIFFFSNSEICDGFPYFHAYSVSHGAIKTMINIYKKEKKKFNYNIKLIDIKKNNISYLSHIVSNGKNSEFKIKVNELVREIFSS